jgi:hypothetical protein
MYRKTTAARSIVFSVTLVTLLGAACTKSPTAPTDTATKASTTTLSFTSDPATFAGPARTYTLQNATFRALSLRSGGALEIDVRPTDTTDRSGPWTVLMGSPFGRGLAPGTYSRTQLRSDGDYLFEFLGGTLDCYDDTATMTIHEIAIDANSLQRLHASFTLRCKGPWR